jgi:hypothetical protein
MAACGIDNMGDALTMILSAGIVGVLAARRVILRNSLAHKVWQAWLKFSGAQARELMPENRAGE